MKWCILGHKLVKDRSIMKGIEWFNCGNGTVLFLKSNCKKRRKKNIEKWYHILLLNVLLKCG